MSVPTPQAMTAAEMIYDSPGLRSLAGPRDIAHIIDEATGLPGLVDLMEKFRPLVRDLCERLEMTPCIYDSDGDCGNWLTCVHDCPLATLRTLAGYKPQKDGGISHAALKESQT